MVIYLCRYNCFNESGSYDRKRSNKEKFKKNQILYEATGKPYLMLAVVANEQTPRVVASLVYNHYEYTGDLGKAAAEPDNEHGHL